MLKMECASTQGVAAGSTATRWTLVEFLLNDQRFALDLATVERVLPALELTCLPNAPNVILGVFCFHGRIIPVADLRRRLGLAPRDIVPQQHIIVARAAARTLGIVVDLVRGVIEIDNRDTVPAEVIVGPLQHITGIARTAEGLLLIHDLATVLRWDEAAALDDALAGNGHITWQR
jgi:purine-binding chemotaxis protein CheW